MADLLTDITEGVLTLTFNRLDKKNSISTSMYATLAEALQKARDDGAVRAVVFQGHETIFSSGNDIGDFLNQPPSTQDSQAGAGGGVRPCRGHWYHAAVPLRLGVRR